jgi:chromosome partitioning protein
MKTVAMVCQKGGTGKTTLALSLAVEAIHSGLNTVVVDLDPQVSACEWGDMRCGRGEAASEVPVVVDAQPARLGSIMAKAREAGVDLLVIDTAGRTEQAAMAAARAADLVLVPLQPSVIDLKTVKATADLIALAGSPERMAVLMRVKTAAGARHDETRAWLERQGMPVCPAVLGDRVTFQDAYAQGLGVTEYEPGGKAAGEVQQVYLHISRIIGLSISKEARNG